MEPVELKMPQLRWLLTDLAAKLEHSLGVRKASWLPAARKKPSAEHANLDRHSPLEVRT